MPIESTRDRLRQVSLFAALEDEALDRLAGLSRVLHLPRKHVLFAEGEPYRGMYLVLEGLAVVYKLSADGRMLILTEEGREKGAEIVARRTRSAPAV